MRPSIPLIHCLVLMLGISPCFAKSFTYDLDSNGANQLELDLDPYYSDVDFIFAINQDSVPRLNQEEEMGVYSYLFFNMAKPQFGLLEASINPLPYSGTLLNKNAPSVFDKGQISPGLNAFTALTAGFPEPWAISYFLGNMVDLIDADSANVVRGKGFGGALLSLGNYHILNSQMIPDYWGEAELKLKGSTISRSKKMSWSFRIGTKIHSHTDIYNVLYFSVKRDRVDLKEPLTWNWKNLLLRNSDFELRSDVRFPRGWKLWTYLTEITALAGKKWPSQSGNWAFSLTTGLQVQLQNGYRGVLASQLPQSQWSILIRPNIEF